MSILACRVALGLWILWGAAGCATANQGVSPSQPVMYEARATESEKEAAVAAHVACLYKAAREMDDGRSDARTIATAVRSTCRSLYNRSLNVWSQGQSTYFKQEFHTRNQNNDIDMATTAVVRTRANANKPPAARPSAPTPVAAPPPMIPPG